MRNIILCYLLCLLGIVYCANEAIGACYVIPDESTVTYPTSGTAIPASGTLSNTATTYLVNSNLTLSSTSNITNGTTGTAIYITNGATLTVGADFNPNGNVKVYVQTGARLVITGNYNSSTTTVYGTLVTSGVSLQNSSANIYIASTGVWNASSATLNMSGGTVVVEGTAMVNRLNQFQNAGTSFCINKSGCVQFNQIDPNLTLQNSVFTDNGIGYVYWNNTTCPKASGFSLTTSSSLNVCSAETPGPCAFWGGATVKYNCVPAAPNNNCAGAIALPITLVYFKATPTAHGVQLKWATAQQTNSGMFIVEESVNGETWEEVGRLASKGNHNGYLEYSLFDEFPRPGNNYYRLKEEDLAGNTKVYSIDLVQISLDEVLFLLYPNPSNGTFNVEVGDAYERYDLEITDINGKSISTHVLRPGNNPFSFTKTGVYLAKLKVGHDIKVQKIVVQ